MQRLAELALWVVLLVLPAGLAARPPAVAADAAAQTGFLALLEAPAPRNRSLSRSWFGFFGHTAWGTRVGIAAGWLVVAAALVVLVAAGAGLAPAAMALGLLLAHPAFWGLGRLATPWLPALAFVLVGLAFLQGMTLPALALRGSRPRRWVPRLMAMTGCGLSLGLASSAEARLVWIVLVPGSLFLLACAYAGLALWRLRRRRGASFLRAQRALGRRALPFAAAWFLIVLLLWQVSVALETPSTEALAALVAPAGSLERACGWAALPGILLLGWREGLRLGFRSELAGSSVLLLVLVVLWLHGPTLRADAGPLERLLGVPMLAAALGSLVRRT